MNDWGHNSFRRTSNGEDVMGRFIFPSGERNFASYRFFQSMDSKPSDSKCVKCSTITFKNRITHASAGMVLLKRWPFHLLMDCAVGKVELSSPRSSKRLWNVIVAPLERNVIKLFWEIKRYLGCQFSTISHPSFPRSCIPRVQKKFPPPYVEQVYRVDPRVASGSAVQKVNLLLACSIPS